ncbi:MAG: hypothetical protein GY714_02685 [Desulfobacterales bacterium]|nr:hypothetical protein [Desulfobacterales bacterium]
MNLIVIFKRYLMNMKTRLLKLFIIVFLFSFVNAYAGDRIPSLLVGNSWKLKKTSKGSPSKMFIKEYKVNFLHNGNWFYECKLTGKYKGMTMKGSGKWNVKGETLIYTAGDNSGKSHIEIDGDILKFDPDPVVFYNGSEPIKTLYYKDK